MSAICQQIKDEYQVWALRRLDEVRLDYLFLDASFFRMHPGSPAEPVLAAWGITTEGKPAFIGLAPGSGESADTWHDFLAGLAGRGLASPLLVISDGAPGLISAIEQVYPKALRQRCLVHYADLRIMPRPRSRDYVCAAHSAPKRSRSQHNPEARSRLWLSEARNHAQRAGPRLRRSQEFFTVLRTGRLPRRCRPAALGDETIMPIPASPAQSWPAASHPRSA